MTVSISTNQIPDRSENEDEAVILLVLRRTDPENPQGDPLPDISSSIVTNTTLAQAMIDHVSAIGFDPAKSYLGVVSLTDAEVGGIITATDLASYIAQNG